LDCFVGAVVGGFEFAGRLVLGVGAVVEAAIGERAAQAFVEEQEEERDLNAFGGEDDRRSGSRRAAAAGGL